MFEDKFYRTTWFNLKDRPFDHYPTKEPYFISVGTCVARDRDRFKGTMYLDQLSIKLNLDYLNISLDGNNLQWQDIQIQKILKSDLKQKFILVQLQRPYYWKNSAFYTLLGDKNMNSRHPLPTKENYIKGCEYLKNMVSWYYYNVKNIFFFNHLCYSKFEFRMLEKTIGNFENVYLDRWIHDENQTDFDQQTHNSIYQKLLPWLKEKIK
jgi:hypothetical protein